MDNIYRLQGRCITDAHLQQVRDLITHHSDFSRRRLSITVAQLWDWRTATGRLKDMAARTLLLKLHQRQWIALPPRRKEPSPRLPAPHPFVEAALVPETTTAALADLLPLRVEALSLKHPLYASFAGYLAHFHYLGYHGPVGENLAYQVSDRTGRDVACLLFGAAAWKIKPRDAFIGWDDLIRSRHLSLLTNNTRFLILPWIRVPHLASHVLALVTRRLASDWQTKYGHPVYLAETFVEKDRFKGTCYRAANWQRVGQTQGRGRQDRFAAFSQSVKDIYLYPLTPRFREALCHVHA